MDWEKLLSTKRFRGSDVLRGDLPSSSEVRSPFTKDADRIVFSPSFRRLQDKTQVHLGPRIDVMRTRLTHTLEASSIGRSLGMAVGAAVIRNHKMKTLPGCDPLEAGDFGAIVAAGCLAHDIGNTPFGHAGEEAIQHWFREEADEKVLDGLSKEEANDMKCFEGNAQGFRVLTKLEGWQNMGGLRLTAATLGAFIKYPRPSTTKQKDGSELLNGKFNYFQDDESTFKFIAVELGLRQQEAQTYNRHPLAYLVEASDDISYLIADLEDGVDSRALQPAEVEGLLTEIVPEDEKTGLSRIVEPATRVAYLRAKAIGVLIEQVTSSFLAQEQGILSGNGPNSLLSTISSKKVIDAIRKLSQEKLYKEPVKLTAELAGYEVVHGLLDIYVEALLKKQEAYRKQKTALPKYEKIHKLLGSPDMSDGTKSPYKWLLSVTDRISAMTDSAAIQNFRRLKGISIG